MTIYHRVGDSFLPVQGCASDIANISRAMKPVFEAVDGMMDDPKGLLFDVTQGAYWYCIERHMGQGSPLYQAATQLEYKPAPSEKGADTEVSKAAYDSLVAMGPEAALEAVLALKYHIDKVFGRDD